MNRRSEPRFDVYHRAKIIPVEHPENAIDAELTDISGSGMRLVTAQTLPEDLVICIEVGQHLVLAEVRGSTPRGSRYLIGAEKVHTLNLLTLPDSIGPADRIQALVDDYHLRLQFELGAGRNGDGKLPDQLVGAPELAEMGEEASHQESPDQASPDQTSADPAGSDEASLDETTPDEASPDEASPDEESPDEASPNEATPLEASPVMELPCVELLDAEVPDADAQPVLLSVPSVAEPTPQSGVKPLSMNIATPPMASVEVPLEFTSAVSEETEQDPNMAPAIRSDPSPAAAPRVPLSPEAKVDFGRLRIVLPEGQGIAHDTILEDGMASDIEHTTALATLEAPEAQAPEPADQAAAELPDEPSPSGPAGPILMKAPVGTPPNGEAAIESDPLRALAIQGDLARVAAEPQKRNHSRTIAAVAAALAAAVVLAALLFGPIRNRATLSPTAVASEKSVKNAENNPKDPGPVAAPSTPEPAASPTPTPASPPAPTAPPTTPPIVTPAPKAIKVPVAASKGSRVHSSSVRTTAPSWIWACVDGKPLTGRMLATGSDLQIDFSREAWVLIGDAAAVKMDLDGNPLGALGPAGSPRAVDLTPTGFHVAQAVGSNECGNP